MSSSEETCDPSAQIDADQLDLLLLWLIRPVQNDANLAPWVLI